MRKSQAQSRHLGIWQAPSSPYSLQDQHSLKLHECGPQTISLLKCPPKVSLSESGDGKEKVKIIVLKQKMFQEVGKLLSRADFSGDNKQYCEHECKTARPQIAVCSEKGSWGRLLLKSILRIASEQNLSKIHYPDIFCQGSTGCEIITCTYMFLH